MNLIIYTDGGARGNPGPAAIGVVIYENDTMLTQFGKKIGETTNNVAEYQAVIEALRYVKNHKMNVTEISFFLDSKLVVSQLNGVFKVKQEHLRAMINTIRVLEKEVGERITYTHVFREQNSLADAQVNMALDTI